MKKLKVLLLEDNEYDMELIKLELLNLKEYEFEFKWVISKKDFLNAINNFSPDIILSDYNLPQFTGLDALKLSFEKNMFTPFIIVTGALSEEKAVDCIKEGVWDYVVKERLYRLPTAVENALKLKNEKIKNRTSELELRLIKSRADIQIKLLYDAIDRAPTSVVITDELGTILYVNPTFEKTTGYIKQEILGQNPRVLKSNFHAKSFYKNMWDTLLQGKEWKGELLNKKKNGNLYWEHASISPIQDENGKIANFVAIRQDITDSKLQNEATKSREKLYKALFENTGTATCIVDWDNTISLANDKFTELSGFSKEELEGKIKWINFVEDSDIQKLSSYQDQLFKSEKEKTIQYEFSFLTKTGDKKTILLTISAI